MPDEITGERCAEHAQAAESPRPDSAVSMNGLRGTYDSETKLSWVLAGLAGLLGATAFTHSAGYFVTFMTGNAQRAVMGYYAEDDWVAASPWLAVSAALLLVAFVAGVISASLCRRYLWPTRPYATTVLTTLALVLATVVDGLLLGGPELPLPFFPIVLMTFGIGALNTTFVDRNGEVSIPLSYVTGTLVKMGQGIERHLSGGELAHWLGYGLLFGAFVLGAGIGGGIGMVAGGTYMLAIASVVCAMTTGYTYFFAGQRRLRS
ncbi:transmembrane protein [Mycolicibacter terrae]|nr:transmembrane protein [Mycolicibacter terrae]